MMPTPDGGGLPIDEAAALRSLVATAPWRDTVREPEPHQYVMRWLGRELHAAVIAAVKAYGYVGTYRGRSYRYVDLDGYKYWTIGDACNREPLP